MARRTSAGAWLFFVGGLLFFGGAWVAFTCETELRKELPTQPNPENVVVHQLLRWHDCETNTVCYATSKGLDCVKDIDTPWLIAECGEETQ